MKTDKFWRLISVSRATSSFSWHNEKKYSREWMSAAFSNQVLTNIGECNAWESNFFKYWFLHFAVKGKFPYFQYNRTGRNAWIWKYNTTAMVKSRTYAGIPFRYVKFGFLIEIIIMAPISLFTRVAQLWTKHKQVHQNPHLDRSNDMKIGQR